MKITTQIREFDWLSALIAAPFAIFLWWLFTSVIDRDPPVAYIHAKAVEVEVPAGEAVTIQFTVDRKRNCQVLNVYRYIRDRYGIDHAVANYTVAPNPRDGFNVYDRLITVPKEVPPGPAEYFIRIRFACNMLHHLGWPISMESPRARFIVTEPLVAPSSSDPLGLPGATILHALCRQSYTD